MRKIFLSAGHGGDDPGAVSEKFIERDLAIELRELISTELGVLGIEPIKDPNSNALSQTLSWLRNKFGSKDILLDIHWNAASSTQANGSEVIIPNTSTSFERQLATAILGVFTSYGFKPRGVKPESQTARKTLGWMRPNAENILLEVCFLTNNLDMKLYQANKQGIAKKIAKVLSDFSKI
jgi:N-acetylmuramoyl-L-alanine amidase